MDEAVEYALSFMALDLSKVTGKYLRDHAAKNLKLYCTDFSRGAFLFLR